MAGDAVNVKPAFREQRSGQKARPRQVLGEGGEAGRDAVSSPATRSGKRAGGADWCRQVAAGALVASNRPA